MFSFNIKIYLLYQHVKYYKIHITNGSLCEQEIDVFPSEFLVCVCIYHPYIYKFMNIHTFIYIQIKI